MNPVCLCLAFLNMNNIPHFFSGCKVTVRTKGGKMWVVVKTSMPKSKNEPTNSLL